MTLRLLPSTRSEAAGCLRSPRGKTRKDAGGSRHRNPSPGSEPRTPFPKSLGLLPVAALMRLSSREAGAAARAQGCQPGPLSRRLLLDAEARGGGRRNSQKVGPADLRVIITMGAQRNPLCAIRRPPPPPAALLTPPY